MPFSMERSTWSFELPWREGHAFLKNLGQTVHFRSYCVVGEIPTLTEAMSGNAAICSAFSTLCKEAVKEILDKESACEVGQ